MLPVMTRVGEKSPPSAKSGRKGGAAPLGRMTKGWASPHYKIEAKGWHAGTIGKFDHDRLCTIRTDAWFGIQAIDFSMCKFHDQAVGTSCWVGQQGRSLSNAKREAWKRPGTNTHWMGAFSAKKIRVHEQPIEEHVDTAVRHFC